MDSRIFVEVGSGKSPRPGWIHCDIYPGESVKYVCRAWAIPFKPNSVHEIYARHVLEHLTHKEAIRTLKHWLCVLKLGGRIDINVPDLRKHIEQLGEKGYSPYINFKVTNEEHAMAGFYGWQKNIYDIHKWGYTFETLSKLLREIGYNNIRRIEDSSISGPLNLRIIAEKSKLLPNLKLDSQSLRPRWTYYNWLGLIRKAAHKLKVKKIIKGIARLFRLSGNLFKIDYSGKGERQVSTTLDGIRPDHIGRYKFVCQFIDKDGIVFDCGCGVGYGSFILARGSRVSKIISVDNSPQAIEFANRYYRDSKIDYITGNIFSLDIANDYFDCIVSFEIVEHVDGITLVKLLYKKLKKGGLLIISTPNQKTQPFNKEKFNFHLRHYTPLEFSQLLTSNGFEILTKYTQYNREKEEVLEGWDGLFNIAVSKKI